MTCGKTHSCKKSSKPAKNHTEPFAGDNHRDVGRYHVAMGLGGGGGGQRECTLPLGFSGPRGAKTPAEATEILTEVRNLRGNLKKHVRAVGAYPTSWAHQKNRAPVTIRGHPNCHGPLITRAPPKSHLSGSDL